MKAISFAKIMYRRSIKSLFKKLLNGTRSNISSASGYISRGADVSSNTSYAKIFPPLSQPYKVVGIDQSPYLPDAVERCPTRVTTLPNGLRIASEDAMGPAGCIGIFVDSGSIYESDKSIGVTHLLERLAFKSTKNRSHLQIVHEVENTGGNITASGSREQMAYSYDTIKTFLPEAVDLLVDCIKNPLFLDNEVEEQVAQVKREIKEILSDPQKYLLESLQATAYSGPLGNPLLAPEHVLECIDGAIIRKFYHENYSANRIVLAAYGIEHDHLLALAEPLLNDIEMRSSVELPKSVYTGGDSRHSLSSEMTHVALAFEVPGWHQEKCATALTVMQTLMGGGGSFSAGGPGKGMHSRLYLRVLNAYQQVQCFSAISAINDDSGIFGIFLTTGSDFVSKAVDIAASELLAIATPGKVTQREFSRAKNSTKSAVLVNLESRGIVAEDIGRQVLTYGCRKPAEHFLQMLDELTVDDITMLAQKMLSSKLTMACLGDVDKVPDYDTVSKKFHASF